MIALIPEVKWLGIKMGTPYFQNRDVLGKRHIHIRVFSSNYALYGDMSLQMMQVTASAAVLILTSMCGMKIN
jgi:DNA polymerase V